MIGMKKGQVRLQNGWFCESEWRFRYTQRTEIDRDHGFIVLIPPHHGPSLTGDDGALKKHSLQTLETMHIGEKQTLISLK